MAECALLTPLPTAFLARSRFVATRHGLETLLGAPVRRCYWRGDILPYSVVLAWGRKRSGLAAERFAARHDLPLLHLEDGFLRSIGHGLRSTGYAVSLDDQGIYYDASRPSRLEALIRQQLSPAQADRARRLVQAWREGRVSKYNHAREYAGALPEEYVLVVDQTLGDGSIRHGLATAASFQRMLEAALDEHPAATVLLKVHPEVVCGRKQGHFDLAALARLDRVRVLGDDAHPVRLLEQARAVYTVTSQMGFEGLLWGKPVRTFGMPFYAGWGLTLDEVSGDELSGDEVPVPERRGTASLEQLVHAALIDYTRYLDPETGARCEVERLLDWLALQRRMRERLPATVQVVGASRWQRPQVRQLLQGPTVEFLPATSPPPHGALQLITGEAPGPHPALRLKPDYLEQLGLPGACLEQEPEALIRLLETMDFSAALLDRARDLQRRIWRGFLANHCTPLPQWKRPAQAGRVVLAIGDSPDISLDARWLRQVRATEAAAYIVYKPTVGVLTTTRKHGKGTSGTGPECDALAPDLTLPALLAQVDAVHVMTSAAGFVALLWNAEVHCHGRPFFSGWGLTQDEASAPRRIKRLSLEQLIAGALLVFPTYISKKTGYYTTPEHALQELQDDSVAASFPAWIWNMTKQAVRVVARRTR